MTALRLISPVPGLIRALAEVPDPVFAEQMVGPGLAVEPVDETVQRVLAPCEGTLAVVHPHAVALDAADGRSVLVHLGIDTVTLAGQGFAVNVRAGDTVRAGDLLLTWSPHDVAVRGLSTLCAVVAVQADPAEVEPLAAPGSTVRAGDPMLDWR